jgi:glycosyltransferase involved in cell wall biosynthesis
LKISENRGFLGYAYKAMRILIVVNEFPPDIVAGTAVSTASLAKHLARQGHKVRVLVTEKKQSPHKESWERVEIRRLSWRGPKGTRWLVRLYFIWRESIAFRPHILQGQAISCGLLVAIIGRLLGIPSIAYAQGQDVYQAKPWQFFTEIRWGCRWSTAVAAVTTNLAERLTNLCGRMDVHVLPHGFEMSVDCQFRQFLREKRNEIQDGFVVLSVGRLEYVKGYDVLLSAWPAILVDFPRAQLWLVGDGSKQEALERQAEVLGISDSIDFWGYLAPQKVAAIMSVADLFVLPSRSEAFGIVLLEAMSQGLPVIAAKVEGIPEVIPPSGDVYLVTPEDAPALSASIVKGLRYFKRPSDRNRAWAKTFVWDQLVYRFEHFYETMCK